MMQEEKQKKRTCRAGRNDRKVRNLRQYKDEVYLAGKIDGVHTYIVRMVW